MPISQMSSSLPWWLPKTMATRNTMRDDRQAAAPLAHLAVPAPLLGPLVLDGVRVGTDDALFATRLVDPLRVTHG